MRQSGYIKTLAGALLFPALPVHLRKRIQKARLKRLVKHVKSKSPFFAMLYKDIPDDFALSDLPVTTKQIMMENFDSYITDRSVNMQQVHEFKKNARNIGSRIGNKYMIAETSGSTGYPATVLLDKTSQNVESVISCLRALKYRIPISCVCVDDGFGVFNGSIRQNKKNFFFLRRLLQIVNAKKPLSEMARELNAFKPKVVIGYPGTLELLTDEALTKDLKIKPKLVLVSGETLTEATRRKLKTTFKCPVHSIYACTEGGTTAFECRYNRLHINDDWCILEPVDSNYNPVPPGQISDKVLLTNLANITQPFIRYELTDRIVLHDGTCPCGKQSWIEVEGRTGDILHFSSGGKSIAVAPMSLCDTMDLVTGVKHYQLVLHEHNRMELRLICMDGEDGPKVFEAAKEAIIGYLKCAGVDGVTVYLSNIPPQFDPRSGKFRQIYQVKSESGHWPEVTKRGDI